MNLYIIENVLWDYTPGMVCIVAENLEQCRDLYMDKFKRLDFDMSIYKVIRVVDETPRIVSYVYGGA